MTAIGQSPYSTGIYPYNGVSNSASSEPVIKKVQLDNGYYIWTKSVGHGPKKMLVLHGGPGFQHKYLEPSFTSNLPRNEYEIIYYDQLGSGNSDKPEGPDMRHLWTIPRFFSELEQVVEHLFLENQQFVIFGHSWGGLLAMEYALKHPGRLKGLIISSMTADMDSYVSYINKLRGELPESIQEKLKAYEDKEQFEDPEYTQLLFKELYCKHICRLEQWPQEAMESMQELNKEVLNEIQGPNEFIFNGNGRSWNRSKDLKDISSPTLVISGRYDTMDPDKMTEMAELIPQAVGKICENGSHLTFFDAPEDYFSSIKEFTKGLY